MLFVVPALQRLQEQRSPGHNFSLQEARELLNRSRVEGARLTSILNASGEGSEQPATTEAPTDAQVDAIRRTVGARVAG